jgi:hypothetical protein
LLVPGNVFLAQFSLAPAPDWTRTNEVSALDVVQPTSVGHLCGNVTIVSDLFFKKVPPKIPRFVIRFPVDSREIIRCIRLNRCIHMKRWKNNPFPLFIQKRTPVFLGIADAMWQPSERHWNPNQSAAKNITTSFTVIHIMARWIISGPSNGFF